jgi:hypothetical protein
MESLVGWSRDQLAEIDRQLLPIVGPVARILVREAAATTASRQELYQLLASNLSIARFRDGSPRLISRGRARAICLDHMNQLLVVSRAQPIDGWRTPGVG